jgi:beta-glucanase (GH16 family)
MFSKSLLISLAATLVLFASCEQSDPVEPETVLVWSDEFDGTELDESKWECMLGDGSNYGIYQWGNSEEQWYKKENALVENGMLRVKVKKETVGDYSYTSARIRSLDMGDFKYGRIEASIRMASTAGLWHAFWLLPSSPLTSWPSSGEIDIMEYVGKAPNEVLNTIHFADAFDNHNYIGEPQPFLNDNDFHLYTMEWDENKITWFIDGEETFKVLRSNQLVQNTWPFDAEFHILFNTAVGGTLGGDVDHQALLTPKYMEVDYVRVFQEVTE